MIRIPRIAPPRGSNKVYTLNRHGSYVLNPLTMPHRSPALSFIFRASYGTHLLRNLGEIVKKGKDRLDFGHYERGKGISHARELQWQLFYKLVKDFLPFWGCIQKMRFNQCGIVLSGTLVERVLFDDSDRLLKQNLFVQKVTYIFRSLAGGKAVMEFELINFKVGAEKFVLLC